MATWTRMCSNKLDKKRKKDFWFIYKNFGFSHSGFPCFHDKRAGISKIFPFTQCNNNLKFSIIVNLFKKGKKAFSSHSITPIICFNRLSFLLLYDTYKKCKKVLAPPLTCFLQTRCSTIFDKWISGCRILSCMSFIFHTSRSLIGGQKNQLRDTNFNSPTYIYSFKNLRGRGQVWDWDIRNKKGLILEKNGKKMLLIFVACMFWKCCEVSFPLFIHIATREGYRSRYLLRYTYLIFMYGVTK